jgi:hypothetical protein
MDIIMGDCGMELILQSNDLLNFYHIISSQSCTVCRDPFNNYELCTSAIDMISQMAFWVI